MLGFHKFINIYRASPKKKTFLPLIVVLKVIFFRDALYYNCLLKTWAKDHFLQLHSWRRDLSSEYSNTEITIKLIWPFMEAVVRKHTSFLVRDHFCQHNRSPKKCFVPAQFERLPLVNSFSGHELSVVLLRLYHFLVYTWGLEER